MKEITECIRDIGCANSTLDLTFGFWQMQLDEKSQPLTAFTIPGQGPRPMDYVTNWTPWLPCQFPMLDGRGA